MLSLPLGMSYVVITKQGDPILRPARARLIWAANTAAATGSLGISCLLAGGVNAFKYRIENIAGKFSVYRALETLYGVERKFDICLLHKDSKNQDWTAEGDFLRGVLPSAGIVHTRDPRIALVCVKRNTPYILENHDEDYQKDFDDWEGLKMSSGLCLALVAITEAVKRQLVERGFPENKIIVLDSGVNESTGRRRPTAAARWRHALLDDTYTRLAVYTGGMQSERGIGDILHAAGKMPDMLFVMAGGHSGDLKHWRTEIIRLGLSNVRIIGYQNHETICELQQAADVVIFARAAGGRPEMTSPLKIFEYLLSGAPVVAAAIPVTKALESPSLALRFYDPSIPEHLVTTLRSTVRELPYKVEGYLENIKAGEPFTWQNRQRKLLDFIGEVQVKTTF
jgi:glycosyltransferase involved in cell wall biosynthesis